MRLSHFEWVGVVVVFCLLGCNASQPDGELVGSADITARPLKRANGDTPLFQRLEPERTGIDFAIPIDAAHPLKRLYASGFFCGGVAVGDVDGDGLPDIFLVNGPGQNRLYRQIGDLRFEDITDRARIGDGDAWGTGTAMADIDNDGDLDIYLCHYDTANALYINQGNGTFVESARSHGLDIVDCSLLPAFCDYDRDGDLDCYLLTNRYYREGGLPSDMKLVSRNGEVDLPAEYQRYYDIHSTGRNRGKLTFIGRPDRLLRNDGEDGFVDVTADAGISIDPGHGLSSTWWDYNRDGYFDLYVANDFEDPDHLYRNNGDGSFTDVINEVVPHTPWFSMGADAGDINNDGLIDFLVSDMSATTHYGQKTTMGAMGNNAWFLEHSRPLQYMRNALFINSGTGRFLEAAYMTGLDSSDWTWSVRFADLDNDGRLDTYITNGMTRNLNDSDLPFTVGDQVGMTKWELYEDLPSLPQQNLAYRNLGGLRFEDVTRKWNLDHTGVSCAAATADLDRDGDLDLVVVNVDESLSIYRNQLATGNSVLVRLRGTTSNRWGVGATVYLRTAEQSQMRQMIPTRGFLTCDDPLIHFGTGNDESVQEMTVHWPSGHIQRFKDLPAGHLYTITESWQTPSAQAPPKDATTVTKEPFFRSRELADVVHHETRYDDFQRQPLLPYKLSQLGPGIAAGDVDGDGDEDLFVAGAAGQSGQLCFNRQGSFHHRDRFPFSQDAICEDMAPLFFDAEADGDLDLYVASGGVECEPDDQALQDRLYLNDGRGNFIKASEDWLPARRESSSVVAASDFDRDGDLDLFVGGRVIPGQYPVPATSCLLRNDGGRLADVTPDVAPELVKTGMVTGALWSDVDNDGWPDLLITHEWGPIKLFRNQQGRLTDATSPAGLSRWTGWWTGIGGRDFDGDGDVDYVVTNFGLNTKYHASAEHPVLLYYGDFEGSGRKRLVEAEYEGEQLYPMRGRSCSSNAMPFLSERFGSYRSFALASLDEIYSRRGLDQATRFEANTLESGILLNDGSGRMDFRPLPRLAQIAPAFGSAITDVDGDGRVDLYLVQNFFSPQVETGRMQGGLSVLLRGEGDGSFQTVWPAESGLQVAEDAKALVVTDVNSDGRQDFVVGINDGALRVFERQSRSIGRVLTVKLKGTAGNSAAVGARVTVYLRDGTRQVAEVHAGSGYLSQSTTQLTFGLGVDGTVTRIEVQWPDGVRSNHRVGDEFDVVLSHPGASDSS